MSIKTSVVTLAVLALSGLASAQGKLSVFVSGTDYGGGRTASETGGHLIKVCPELTITLDREKADYILVRDYTGAGPGRKPQKVTVFNRNHELIFAGADRSIAGAVKDACQAILGRRR